MKDHTLDQAIIEATRFLTAAKALRASRKLQSHVTRIDPYQRSTRLPRESGTLRRASMDLTRKLADLRQGR